MTITIVSDTEDVNPLGGSISIAEPVSLAVGDLMLSTLNVAGNAGSTNPPGLISGFTNLGTNVTVDGSVSSETYMRDCWRVADGTEGPTYTSTITGGSLYSTGKILRITGADPNAPVSDYAIDGDESSGGQLPTVVASATGKAVAFICTGAGIGTGPAGWSLYEVWDTTQAVYSKDVTAGDMVGGETFTLPSGGIWQASVSVIADLPPQYVSETADDNAAGGDIVITEPASLAVGDLLLAFLTNFAASAATPALISGFTNIATISGGVVRTRDCWRVADGTEGPTYTSTVAAPTDFSGGDLLRITGADPVDPIHNSGTNSGSGTTLTLPSVSNTSGQTCLAIAYIAPDEAITADPAGWNVDGGAGSGLYWKYVIDGASSGAGTATAAAAADYTAAVVLIVGVTGAAPAASPIDDLFVADRGSQADVTAGLTTAVDLAAGGSIRVGNILIARVAVDNSGTNGAAPGLVVTETRGNKWYIAGPGLADPGAAAAGAACYICWTTVQNPYTNGDDITFTWGVSTTAKAIRIEEWTGLNASSPVVPWSPNLQSGATTAVSVESWFNTAGQIVYTCLAIEGPSSDTFTEDSNHFSLTSLSTSTGTAASNQTCRGAVKYGVTPFSVSGGSVVPGETYNATLGTTRDWAAVSVALMPANQSPPSGPYVLSDASVTISASQSCTFDFQHSPKEGDLILAFPSSTGVTVTLNTVTGWPNILGGTTDVESDSHQMCGFYHVVTAAEETAQTLTWTISTFVTVAQTGNVCAILVRDADPNNPLAGVGSTFNSGNTVTPHVLAGVTPTIIGGLVVSCVTKDGTGAYGTTPTGWTGRANNNTNQGKWLGTRDTLTTSLSAISAVNITPSAGDEYASITVVVRRRVAQGWRTVPPRRYLRSLIYR